MRVDRTSFGVWKRPIAECLRKERSNSRQEVPQTSERGDARGTNLFEKPLIALPLVSSKPVTYSGAQDGKRRAFSTGIPNPDAFGRILLALWRGAREKNERSRPSRPHHTGCRALPDVQIGTFDAQDTARYS